MDELVEECLACATQALDRTLQCHNFLSPQEFKSNCEAIYKQAMDQLSARVAPNHSEQLLNLKPILSHKLSRLFLQLQNENSKRRSKFVQDILENLSSQYKYAVQKEIGENIFLDEEISIILTQANASIKMEFGKNCGSQDPLFFSQTFPKLNSILQQIDKEFQSQNKSKLNKQKLECEKVIENLTNTYKKMLEMPLLFADPKTMTQAKIMKMHETSEQTILEQFSASVNIDNPKIKESAVKELQTRVNEILAEVSSEVAKAHVEGKKEATEIITQTTKTYVESMKRAISAESSETEIQTQHQFQSTIAKNAIYEIQLEYGKQEANRQKAILDKNIADAFFEIKEEIFHWREKWAQGICRNTEQYNELMMRLIGGPRLMPNEEVAQYSSHIQSQIIEECDLSWLIRSERIQKFQSELKEKMDRLLTEFLAANSKKLEECEAEVRQELSTCLNSYKQDMERFLGDESITDLEKLQHHHQEAYQRAEDVLSEKSQALPQPLFLKFKSTLRSEVEATLDAYQNTVTSRINQKQSKVRDSIKKCVQMYSKEMESFHCEKEVQLQEMHDFSRRRVSDYMGESLKEIPMDWLNKAKEDLEEQIKTEFQAQKSRFVLRIQRKEEEELGNMKQSAIELYNNKFQGKLGEIRQENELKEIHEQIFLETINKFGDEFPDEYTTRQFRAEKSNLETELEERYELFLQDFHEKQDLFDAKAKKEIRDIGVGFRSKMDHALRHGPYAYLPEEHLQEMYDKAVAEGLDKLSNYTRDGPKTEVETKLYQEQLVQELKSTLELAKNKNSLKKEKIENEVKNSIQQTKSDFLEILKTMNDPDLPNLLEEHKSKFISKMGKFTFPDDQFMNSATTYLNKSLNEAKEDWMREMEPEPNTLELKLIKATKVYNKTMTGRVDSKGYYTTKTLEAFHSRAVLEARNYFAAEIPQTANVCKIFQETLANAFLAFKDRNNLQGAQLVDAVIGIDLGTTNSCVAVYRNGKAEIIPDRNTHRKVVPSYVLFKSKKEVVVGESAKDQSQIYPELTIFDGKRLIGRKFKDSVTQEDIKLWPFEVVDDNGRPKVRVHGDTYFPEEISAKILNKLKKDAEVHLGCEITSAVITVPAHFNDAQKTATKTAGALAGLNVLKLINEPTAAAIAYSLNYTDTKPKKILVFDLGGGTFDISILQVNGGDLEVIAMDGDTHLGGEDFDNNLVNFCIAKFRETHGLSIFDPSLSNNDISRKLRRIRHKCEQEKINLSVRDAESVKVVVPAIYDSVDMEIDITVTDFNEMNDKLFQKTIDTVQKVLAKKNLSKTDIDEVVLVGGSTRIPRIQKLLKDFFDKPLNMELNPDEVVAHGAAVYAAMLSGSNSESLGHIKFSDVTPLSLGIALFDGRFSIIIPKNTRLDESERTEPYTTVSRNQTRLAVTIYEGEEKIAKLNNILGKFTLTGIPPGPAGSEKIDVTMSCDLEGLLHVKAVIRSTGGNEEIKIQQERHGLTLEEINCLKSSSQQSED